MIDPSNNAENTSGLSRRGLFGAAGLGAMAIAGHGTAAAQEGKEDKPAGPDGPHAFIDGTAPGFVELGEKDFAKVNSADDTWSWKDGVLYCTGKPISVLRTAKRYTNVEISIEWNHREKGGNSGLFVWSDQDVIDKMTKSGKPGLPSGIEVQMLDLGFEEKFKGGNPNRDSSWFTSHGDVFPVRQKMDPFPPLSPNGSRSFPSEDRVKPHGNWNHYYVRAINGEVRLWVNGKEVSGGTNCSTTTGYLCLEAEGSPIEFRNIRLRELP
jgi:hypothetical protein